MYTEIINKNTIASFLENSEKNGLNKKTIKNYKADLNIFLNFLKTYFPNINTISSETIESFVNIQKNNKKSIATINRMLSTLRNYFSYINSIGANIDENILKIKNKKNIYKNFVSFLNKSNLSAKTKINYKSDIANFFDWIKTKNVNEENLEKYQVDYYLFEITNNYSESTINRKKSSFEFFWNWYNQNKNDAFTNYKSNEVKNKYYENLVYFSFMAGMAIVITTYSAINKLNNNFSWVKYINSDNKSQNVIYASDKKDFKFTLKDSFDSSQNIKNNDETFLIISNDEKNILEYKTTGKAEIQKGENFVILSNSKITKDSIIIITPTTNLKNNNLYVSSQKEGIAVVSANFEAESNINFNYLII